MGRGQKAAAAAAAAASAAASVGTPGTAASSVASELQTLLLPAAVATIAVVLSCVQGMLHVNTVRYAKDGAGSGFEHPYKPWLDSHNDSEGRHYRGYKASQNTLEWALYVLPMIWLWAIYNPALPWVGEFTGAILVALSFLYSFFNYQYVAAYMESSKGRMQPFRRRTMCFRFIAFGAMGGVAYAVRGSSGDIIYDKVSVFVDWIIVTGGAPSTWPPYATRIFVWLVFACIALALFSTLLVPEPAAVSEYANSSSEKKDASRLVSPDASNASNASNEGLRAQRRSFRRFQVTYLTVYLITMLADWLQGTNMYTLYSGYDMPVSTLFLTGFTSSAIFGTFVGLYVDKYGRKNGCVLFCVLEIIINTLEHVPNLPLLVFGRILGGISTSLLFSAFESWMVTEHRKRNFPEAWLASTQGLASTGNGIVAVVAGVLAQLAADAFGDIGPFRLAIALTVLCLAFVVAWPENYGAQDTKEDTTFALAMKDIQTKRPVLLLGAIQALYEGAMFTFVFCWVPTILKVAPSTHIDLISGSVVDPSSPPLGLIFGSFMLCITLGGMSFSPLCNVLGVEWATALICGISAVSMLIPVMTQNFTLIFASFLTLEACIGCWGACSANMRSKYIDDKLQVSIMTISRVPLNILVVIGTYMEDAAPLHVVFLTCFAWFSISMFLQIALATHSAATKAKAL